MLRGSDKEMEARGGEKTHKESQERREKLSAEWKKKQFNKKEFDQIVLYFFLL